MSPETLIEETRVSTRDQDEAREFMAGAYGAEGLRVQAPIVGDEQLSIRRLATARVNVSHVSSPSRMDVRYTGLDDEIIFGNMHAGSVTIEHGGWSDEPVMELGPGDVGVAIQPGAECVHRTEPVRNTAVGISEGLLREVVGADPDDATTRWEPLSPRPVPGLAGLWRETSHYVGEVLAGPGADQAPLVVGAAERLLAVTTLTAFPNRLIDALEAPDHEGGPDTLHRAIAFIESNPERDISVADIAAAAHSGQRTVQVAFRKHMDTTPMAYVRHVRLHHAHDELLGTAAGPGATVAAIALKWGFKNQGRFAELYRAEFGEYPSETLQRA